MIFVPKLISDLFNNRELIFRLSVDDFKKRNSGTYLGFLWLFVIPLTNFFLLWFVFTYGLKAGPVGSHNIPYAAWLICGMVPWIFFSETLQATTNCLLEYSFIVKKVVFNLNLLPMIKMISSTFIHLFFIVFMSVLCFSYGFGLSLNNFFLLYYFLCLFVFIFSLSLIFSSVVVFFRDLSNIINMILQFFFWLTPVFWDYEVLPEKMRYYFKLNPLYYIVQGYRSSLLGTENLFYNYKLTICFWSITLVTLFIGIRLFNKLKVHFVDVI